MKRLDELTAQLTALAQEYKQIKLSIAAKNPLANSNAKVAFSPEEAQDFNAKVNKFHGIKDKTQLDEAGKILAEELKTLIPAFLAKYVKVAEGQQKQLAGVKAKAESIIKNVIQFNKQDIDAYCYTISDSTPVPIYDAKGETAGYKATRTIKREKVPFVAPGQGVSCETTHKKIYANKTNTKGYPILLADSVGEELPKEAFFTEEATIASMRKYCENQNIDTYSVDISWKEDLVYDQSPLKNLWNIALNAGKVLNSKKRYTLEDETALLNYEKALSNFIDLYRRADDKTRKPFEKHFGTAEAQIKDVQKLLLNLRLIKDDDGQPDDRPLSYYKGLIVNEPITFGDPQYKEFKGCLQYAHGKRLYEFVSYTEGTNHYKKAIQNGKKYCKCITEPKYTDMAGEHDEVSLPNDSKAIYSKYTLEKLNEAGQLHDFLNSRNPLYGVFSISKSGDSFILICNEDGFKYKTILNTEEFCTMFGLKLQK